MAFGIPNAPNDASDTISDILARESGRLLPREILARTVQISPWIDMVKTGQWQEAMGYSYSVVTMGRVLPVDTVTSKQKKLTWDAVVDTGLTAFDGNPAGISGANAIPRKTTLRGGFSTRSVSLAQTALQSQNLSLLDLKNHFMADRQISLHVEKLSEATQIVLVDRFRDEYDKWADTKVLVTASGPVISSGNAGTATSSVSAITSGIANQAVMSNGLLAKLYSQLVRKGAGRFAMGKQDGAPIFGLITSAEQSRLLKQESNYRDDIRWNPGEVGELLKALGATSAPLMGFQHIIDPLLPRFNWTGAAFAWVPPYKEIAGAGETVIITENEDYETAAWEDSYIFNPEVCLAVFPGSNSNVNAAKFESHSYRGEWRWVNEYDKDSNPDNEIGFFRGLFRHGTEPRYPEFGVVIRHARCDLTPLYAACS